MPLWSDAARGGWRPHTSRLDFSDFIYVFLYSIGTCMQIFMKIDHKKTDFILFYAIGQCFCCRLYINAYKLQLKRYDEPISLVCSFFRIGYSILFAQTWTVHEKGTDGPYATQRARSLFWGVRSKHPTVEYTVHTRHWYNNNCFKALCLKTWI